MPIGLALAAVAMPVGLAQAQEQAEAPRSRDVRVMERADTLVLTRIRAGQVRPDTITVLFRDSIVVRLHQGREVSLPAVTQRAFRELRQYHREMRELDAHQRMHGTR